MLVRLRGFCIMNLIEGQVSWELGVRSWGLGEDLFHEKLRSLRLRISHGHFIGRNKKR